MTDVRRKEGSVVFGCREEMRGRSSVLPDTAVGVAIVGVFGSRNTVASPGRALAQ